MQIPGLEGRSLVPFDLDPHTLSLPHITSVTGWRTVGSQGRYKARVVFYLTANAIRVGTVVRKTNYSISVPSSVVGVVGLGVVVGLGAVVCWEFVDLAVDN